MLRINKSLLETAKAFLCWDVFNELAIQLVPLNKATAYYFPPQNHLHSIIVFYQERQKDFSEPLFLLFHEAGHILQRKHLEKLGREENFTVLMNLDKGAEKVSFERDAWELAEPLFDRFIEKENLPQKEMKARFKKYQEKSLHSYLDE